MAKMDGFTFDHRNRVVLSFDTGEAAPRVFIACLAEEREGDIPSPQLVVHDCGSVDEPLWRLAIVGQSKGNRPRAMKELFGLASMGWGEFKQFCRSIDGYTGEIPDIEQDLPAPRPTNYWNALILGAIDYSGEPDLRPHVMKVDDEDQSVPYSFPAMGRLGMIRELVTHSRTLVEGGKTRMSWWHRPGFMRDQSGKEGKLTVSAEHDEDWKDHYRQNVHEIQERITAEILADIQAEHGLVGPNCELHFEPGGSSHQATLARLDGIDLTFEHSGEMCERLYALTDWELAHVWQQVRCLDHDFDQNRLARAWSEKLNAIRAEQEMAFEAEMRPARAPGM